jgi:hypothetical protein
MSAVRSLKDLASRLLHQIDQSGKLATLEVIQRIEAEAQHHDTCTSARIITGKRELKQAATLEDVVVPLPTIAVRCGQAVRYCCPIELIEGVPDDSAQVGEKVNEPLFVDPVTCLRRRTPLLEQQSGSVRCGPPR